MISLPGANGIFEKRLVANLGERVEFQLFERNTEVRSLLCHAMAGRGRNFQEPHLRGLGQKPIRNACLSGELIIQGQDNFLPSEVAWLDLCGTGSDRNIALCARVAQSVSVIFATFCCLNRDKRHWSGDDQPDVRLVEAMADAGLRPRSALWNYYVNEAGHPMLTCGFHTGVKPAEVVAMRRECAARKLPDAKGRKEALEAVSLGFSDLVVCHKFGVPPTSLPGMKASISRYRQWKKYNAAPLLSDRHPLKQRRKRQREGRYVAPGVVPARGSGMKASRIATPKPSTKKRQPNLGKGSWVSREALAKRMGVTERTIWRAEESGRLQRVPGSKNPVYFSERSVRAWQLSGVPSGRLQKNMADYIKTLPKNLQAVLTPVVVGAVQALGEERGPTLRASGFAKVKPTHRTWRKNLQLALSVRRGAAPTRKG